MIVRREIIGDCIYDLSDYEYEEDMQTICNKLSDKYLLEILNKLEGPGATIWDLRIKGNDISLVNNSWGNFLKPQNEEAKNFIEREFDSLNEILE